MSKVLHFIFLLFPVSQFTTQNTGYEKGLTYLDDGNIRDAYNHWNMVLIPIKDIEGNHVTLFNAFYPYCSNIKR